MYAQLKKRRGHLDERRGSPDKNEDNPYAGGIGADPGYDPTETEEKPYQTDVHEKAGKLADHHQELADAFGRMADEEEGKETDETSSADAVEDDPELMGDEMFGKAEPESSGPLSGGSLRNTEDEEPLSRFEKLRKKSRA